MGRAKIDNPLFTKTESPSLKDSNFKTLKVKKSKTQSKSSQKPKSLKVPNFKTLKALTSKPKEPDTPEFKTLKLAKFKTFKDQVLVRLRDDQLEYLTRLESSIMKGRSSRNKKERITKNSIIRSAIDAIQSLEINTKEIPDEQTLQERIRAEIQSNLEV